MQKNDAIVIIREAFLARLEKKRQELNEESKRDLSVLDTFSDEKQEKIVDARKTICECIGVDSDMYARWNRKNKPPRKKRFGFFMTVFVAWLCAESKVDFLNLLAWGGWPIDSLFGGHLVVALSVFEKISTESKTNDDDRGDLYDMKDTLNEIMACAHLQKEIPRPKRKEKK